MYALRASRAGFGGLPAPDHIVSSISTGPRGTNGASPFRCSLLILDLENPYRYLEVRGNARIEPDDDYTFARKVGSKYHSSDLGAHDRPGESRVIVIIEPVNVYAVDMSGG